MYDIIVAAPEDALGGIRYWLILEAFSLTDYSYDADYIEVMTSPD